MTPPKRPIPKPSPMIAGRPRRILTIGSFDGVHLGHQSLIRRARLLAAQPVASAGPALRVVALVFDPSPIAVLRPQSAPPRLSTFDQRRRWLLEAGVDEVSRLEPTPELLALTPEDFVDRMVDLHRPSAWVEGPDFRFGHARAGDVNTLQALGNERGFEVSVVEPVCVPLSDHSIVPARSTMVRWLLSQGRVRDAACILGRPYGLTGEVIRGDRRGRAIGYPTANLDTLCLAPGDGVYAGLAHLPDGLTFPAAVSVGNKPTFGDLPRAVEAFILIPGAAGTRWAPLPGLPEYGWRLRLDLLAWIRDQIAYESLPELLSQIERDCDRAASIAHDHAGTGAGRQPQEALA